MPFKYPDVKTLGLNAGHAHEPKIQTSAIAEYGDMLSGEIERGEWSMFESQPIHVSGANVEQRLEEVLKNRPHWFVPPEQVDVAEAIWLSGNITEHGKRLKTLEQLLGNKKTADAAWRAEAAQFGVTAPGTTQKGIKPGSKSAEEKTDQSTTNPWSANFRGDEAARIARIDNVIKNKGTKFAAALAKAAGTTIGRPLPLTPKSARV